MVKLKKTLKTNIAVNGLYDTRPVLSNLFDSPGHLVNFPPAGGPQSRGAMASARSASL